MARDYAAEAERIIREGDERIRAAKIEHDMRIARSAIAGKPILIAGFRYIPDPDDPYRPAEVGT